MLGAIKRTYDVFLDRVCRLPFPVPGLRRQPLEGAGCGPAARPWRTSLVDELGGLETGIGQGPSVGWIAPSLQGAGDSTRPRFRSASSSRQTPLPSSGYALDGLRLLGGGKALYLCGLTGVGGRAGE